MALVWSSIDSRWVLKIELCKRRHTEQHCFYQWWVTAQLWEAAQSRLFLAFCIRTSYHWACFSVTVPLLHPATKIYQHQTFCKKGLQKQNTKQHLKKKKSTERITSSILLNFKKQFENWTARCFYYPCWQILVQLKFFQNRNSKYAKSQVGMRLFSHFPNRFGSHLILLHNLLFFLNPDIFVGQSSIVTTKN